MRRLMLRTLAAAWLLFWLAGCEPAREPGLAYLPSGGVILAFGDSLTFGTGATPGEDWPARLAASLGREVINRGVPGETSRAGKQRLPGVLNEVRPDLLILTHGGNDLLRQMDRSALVENLTAMVDIARADGVEVVLVAVPQPTLLRLQSADLYDEVAAQTGVPLERGVFANVLRDERLRHDRAHPNAAGYAEVAKAIEALLHRAGAL